MNKGQLERDAADVRVFPPAVPLVTVVAGIILDRIWPIAPAFAAPPPVRYIVGGMTIVGAFLLLGLWAVITMRRTGQTENPYKPTTEIVANGPFRVSRNPMYLQMVLVCLGFGILLWNVWIVLLTPVCAWVLHTFVILREEAYLEAKFGDGYIAYKRRVRRWL